MTGKTTDADAFFSETRVSECASPLKEILADLLSHPGKCLRGRLLLLCAGLSKAGMCFHEAQEERVNSLAVGVEVLHLAALVHDDLLDRGELRRGYPTVWRLWGDKSAVLVGDHLFATAYRMLHEHAMPRGMAYVNNLIKEMVEAQMEEELNRFKAISLDGYLTRIEKKTARFFQTVCLLGGEAAALPLEITKLCGDFGREIGMAYQILDDLGDLVDYPKSSGKTGFTDWKNGVVTLPLILLDDADKIETILRRVAESIEHTESTERAESGKSTEGMERTVEVKAALLRDLANHDIPQKVWLIYYNYLKIAKKILKEIEKALTTDLSPSTQRVTELGGLVRQLLYKGRYYINMIRNKKKK